MATLEQIQARMKKLQVQAEKILADRAQAALDQIRALMIKHGLTTEDIEARAKARRERARKAANGAAKTVAKGKLPPKYRNPKTGETWSGHARPPAWIKDVKDRSKFLIDAVVDGAAASVAKAAAKSGVVARKAAAKKVAAKKTVGRKVAAVKKAAAKTPAAKKAGRPKGSGVKKAAAKKTPGRKAAAAKKTAAAPVAAPAAETRAASSEA